MISRDDKRSKPGMRCGMSSTKERMTRIIEQQPDNSSYEAIIRELAFALMIERGLEDSEAHRTISEEEMGRRIGTSQSGTER